MRSNRRLRPYRDSVEMNADAIVAIIAIVALILSYVMPPARPLEVLDRFLM